MDQKAVAIVGVSLLLLILGFAIPTMITATKDPQYIDTELSVGEVIEPTEGLRATVTDTTTTEVTVELYDVQTRQNVTVIVANGAIENYTLPGGDGTVENLDSTNQDAMIEIGYDPLYGWSPAPVVIADNIEIILTLVLFGVVSSGIVVVMQ